MIFTDTSEKGLQKYIVKELVEQNKFRESVSNDFDKEFCNNPKQLWEFIKETAYARPVLRRKRGRD